MRAPRQTTKETVAGSLLLAHPKLLDPNFRRSVVLMSLHNAEGAMGVVLNRPLGRRLAELSGDFALGSDTSALRQRGFRRHRLQRAGDRQLASPQFPGRYRRPSTWADSKLPFQSKGPRSPSRSQRTMTSRW